MLVIYSPSNYFLAPTASAPPWYSKSSRKFARPHSNIAEKVSFTVIRLMFDLAVKKYGKSMKKPGLKEIRSTVKSIDYIVTSFGPPSTISNQDYMYNIYQNITSTYKYTGLCWLHGIARNYVAGHKRIKIAASSGGLQHISLTNRAG